MQKKLVAAIFTLCLTLSPSSAKNPNSPRFLEAVSRTASMPDNPQSQQLAANYGLQLLNLTWEDTGRYKDSCVGSNISDMTLQLQTSNNLTCLPVVRYPNYQDRTGDISPDQFFLLVGNEDGDPLHRVSLRQFLGDPRAYLTRPESWMGDRTSLLAERDSHVLVSAQACFLPIPSGGKVEFNPVLFNYQSYEGDPALLTILATREGTSVTVIDNKRDKFSAGATWGQRLFFNQSGQRASLTGMRTSDFLLQAGSAQGTPEGAGEKGLNMVLLIQVPLRQKNTLGFPAYSSYQGLIERGVENAVIGHGEMEGPFTELADLDVERDVDLPVRVTVQFYKATEDGKPTARDMAEIAAQLQRVYEHADYVGSLVTEGETGRRTEWNGEKHEPSGWWEAFWARHLANTGQSKEKAHKMLRNLLFKLWNG